PALSSQASDAETHTRRFGTFSVLRSQFRSAGNAIPDCGGSTARSIVESSATHTSRSAPAASRSDWPAISTHLFDPATCDWKPSSPGAALHLSERLSAGDNAEPFPPSLVTPEPDAASRSADCPPGRNKPGRRCIPFSL